MDLYSQLGKTVLDKSLTAKQKADAIAEAREAETRQIRRVRARKIGYWLVLNAGLPSDEVLSQVETLLAQWGLPRNP